MNKSAFSKLILTALIIAFFLPNMSFSRALFNRDEMAQQEYAAKLQVAGEPFVEIRVHRIGRIGLLVSNQGQFGNGFFQGIEDPRTGEPAPSCEYPIFSGIEYLFAGSFWVGAIVGRDTLVSVGVDGWFTIKEFWPPDSAAADRNGELMTCRSINAGSEFFSPLAKSELDVTCVYYDTLVDGVVQDARDGRPHRPLNIRVRQTSYSWSYEYADDFVLFDYEITNIDPVRTLEKVYMGIYVDGDVLHSNAMGFQDDVTGFRLDVPALSLVPTTCDFRDTINLAWLADNNGFDEGDDPRDYGVTDPIGVTGTRVIRTPAKDTLDISFNWWISNTSPPLDWGPRLKKDFRDLGGFLGTPEGDRNKYHFLSNNEFDYDQLFSCINHEDEGWLPPDNLLAGDFANGFDTRYLLSFGPFIIFPGETLPLTFAYVGGDKFHITSGNNWRAFDRDCLQAQTYYDLLS
ncbi:MAG: hypothetical protein IIB00_10245, partial [candidate division Zixibacteria bacterium]|nr:hypothetical protein [candidate division Zixibacteria bacterium]